MSGRPLTGTPLATYVGLEAVIIPRHAGRCEHPALTGVIVYVSRT